MKKPITWDNVLNYKNISYSTTISGLCREAKMFGYPYFSWNDRIYDTDTHMDTGYIIDGTDIRDESIPETKKRDLITRYQLLADINESLTGDNTND